MNLEELNALEARAWAELEEMKKMVDSKRHQWFEVHRQITEYEAREKARTEILAETRAPRDCLHGSNADDVKDEA